MGHEEDLNEGNDEHDDGFDRDAIDPATLKVEDYSKIIEELQSHRKEIEKLQIDMNGSARNNLSPISSFSQPKVTNHEFFPFCPLEELQHQLDEIIDDDVSGKEEYLTAEDFNTADQGFCVASILFTFHPALTFSSFERASILFLSSFSFFHLCDSKTSSRLD